MSAVCWPLLFQMILIIVIAVLVILVAVLLILLLKPKTHENTGGKGVSWTLDGEFAPGKDEIIIENVPSALWLVSPEEHTESE